MLTSGSLGGAAATMGLAYNRERKAKLKEREEKDKRLRTLESHINPDVTSSNLTLTGEQVRIEGPHK